MRGGGPRRKEARVRTAVELIAAKRDGKRLADEEIRWLIGEFAEDRLPAYQMSALAMAIFYNGLDDRETRTWTDAMLRSGRVLDLAHLGSGRVDKHSTGGVGDKISLPLAPAAAACGVLVPMVAGRGLGHTGGTIDKLEAIPGYRASLDVDTFAGIVREHGFCIMGQTEDIAPADKRLYALRDVTGTVESIPLITASIMSKKLAEGIEGLILDVKVGPGAFMKTRERARELAERMVAVGGEMGKRVIAFLTRMDAPLGRMVGNACEVAESIDVLRGGGPADVVELVEVLGGAMVEVAKGVSFDEGRARIRAALNDGSALARFRGSIAAQGGDLDALPTPTGETVVTAPRDGHVAMIDGHEVGLTAMSLGAGRRRREDVIDPVVGVRVDAMVGAEVAAGAPLATILHGAGGPPPAEAIARLRAAFTLSDTETPVAPLIIERIG
ncbi:MAG: thymidine phosphorylase [Deltaproteobacteria bacterium]|nr:MAG: thymidine phosphorylase [Deltaproteobacteria bacterium]